MKLLSALIASLSGKAGIDPKDELLKKILEDENISHYEVPDEIANPLEQKLLTEESAVVNPIVKSKLFAQALNGVEAELDKLPDEYGLSDDFKSAYKGIERNTNEKVRKLKDGLKARLDEIKKSKTTDADSKATISALEGQIRDLNKTQEDLKRMHTVELENLKTQNLTDKRGYTLQSTLSGKPLPKNKLKPEINIQLARTLVENEMAKHNLIIQYDESGKPVIREKKDGAEIKYFVDNKEQSYDSFVDGVLAQNDFLEVSGQDDDDTNGVNGGFDKNHQFSGDNGNGGRKLTNQTAAAEALQKAKQAMQYGGGAPVGTEV